MNSVGICSDFQYSSMIEIWRSDLFSIEFDPSHKAYTTESIKTKALLIQKIKEKAIKSYIPKYDLETYNVLLSYSWITIDRNPCNIPTDSENKCKQIYTMKVSLHLPDKTINSYGDCFFECADNLMKPLSDSIKYMQDQFDKNITRYIMTAQSITKTHKPSDTFEDFLDKMLGQ